MGEVANRTYFQTTQRAGYTVRETMGWQLPIASTRERRQAA